MKHKWRAVNNVSNHTGSKSIKFYLCERCELLVTANSIGEANEKYPRCNKETITSPVKREFYYADEIKGEHVAFFSPYECYGKVLKISKSRKTGKYMVIVKQKHRDKNRHIPQEKMKGVYNRRNKKLYPIMWENKGEKNESET